MGMKLPKSFNDITVSQFQECYFLLGKNPELEDWIKAISVLTGKSYDEVEDLKIVRLNELIRELSFILDDSRLKEKVKKYVVLNGRVYKATLFASELTAAQAIDLRSFAKAAPGISEQDTIIENLDKLLASLYVPLKWFKFKYNGADHPKICKDFKKAKIGDVYGAVFFCSKVWPRLMRATVQFGELEALKKMEDAMTLMENLETIGDGK